MRVRLALTVGFVCAAAPLWAQSTSQVPGPRTVTAAHVMCAEFPVSAMPLPTIKIKGAHHLDTRTALAEGDSIVIDRTPNDGIAVGQRYLVRRFPVGEDALLRKGEGFVGIKTPGWVTITAVNDIHALAVIDFSCDSMGPGDYLEPYVEPTLPTAGGPMVDPDFSERVRIVIGMDTRTVFGDGDTFSIERGTEHGVVVGARYAIYRDRKDGRPLIHVGDAIVADPSATTSKVLLVTTKDGVEIGDIAVPRRAQQ